jgi:hypothetical protein
MSILVPSRRGFLAGTLSLLAAPAIVRAELIMPVRSIERFSAFPLLPEFSFDSFDDWTGGTAYQWAAKNILGESTGQYEAAVSRGWRPVPASRYNSKFAINGECIEHGGCVLMELDRQKVIMAQQEVQSAAFALVDNWKSRAEGSGFSVKVRTTQGEPEFFTVDWSNP